MKRDEPQQTREVASPKPLLNKIDYGNKPLVRHQAFHREAQAWSKQGRDLVQFFMDIISWFLN